MVSDDKIILSGMTFFAHHGVEEEERQKGQHFEVDVEIYTPLDRAGSSDDLEDTVDYHRVYTMVAKIVTEEKFYLLEALAERLAAKILSNQVIEKVAVRVRKLEPPITGRIDSTAVEITRVRRT